LRVANFGVRLAFTLRANRAMKKVT